MAAVHIDARKAVVYYEFIGLAYLETSTQLAIGMLLPSGLCMLSGLICNVCQLQPEFSLMLENVNQHQQHFLASKS